MIFDMYHVDKAFRTLLKLEFLQIELLELHFVEL